MFALKFYLHIKTKCCAFQELKLKKNATQFESILQVAKSHDWLGLEGHGCSAVGEHALYSPSRDGLRRAQSAEGH